MKERHICTGRRSSGRKVNCKGCANFDGFDTDITGDFKYWNIKCKEIGKVFIGGDKAREDIPGIHCHKYQPLIKPPKRRKREKKCALKLWKEENNKTAAEMLGVSVRQANRYISGEAMPPWHALVASRRTGIPRGRFVFTPKVMEKLK